MEELKKKVEDLLKETGKDEQVKVLQEINHLILTKYMIQIDDKCYYPTEVEAYYYNEKVFENEYTHCNEKVFEDEYTHCDEYQKDRFRKLYFHRNTSENGKFNAQRSGVDVCLSMGNYYYGVLIRGIKSSKETICSQPNIVARSIIAGGKDDFNKSDILAIKDKIEELEKEPHLFLSENDPRTGKIINTCRKGIDHNKYQPFGCYYLRSAIEFAV
jgi:hypothetical protein